MGGSSSKSELSRSKSLMRRSSQRSLFQTAKRNLTAINRKIDKLRCTEQDRSYIELRSRLDEVQKELDSVNDILKDKHKEKYEDCKRHLRETFERLDAKVKQNRTSQNATMPNHEENTDTVVRREEVPASPALQSKVELSLIKVIPTPEYSESKENRLSRASEEETQSPKGEEHSPRGDDSMSSKASRFSKFGVQVLPPVVPQTRLTMLLENKKRTSESASTPSTPSTPQQVLEIREKYRPTDPGVPQSPDTPPSTPLFKKPENRTPTSSPVSKRTPNEIKTISPPVIRKKQEESFQNSAPQVIESGKAKLTKTECYKIIEDSQEYTDHLERQLKLFKGDRDDPVYFYLQEGFFRNLMKLDSIEPGDDAVLRQEKKLSVKRIKELIKVLDMKVSATLNNEAPLESSDDDVFDEYEPVDKKISLKSNGKPAVATHL